MAATPALTAAVSHCIFALGNSLMRAAPDAMHLTDEQRDEIRARLEEMATQLEKRIKSSKDQSAPVDLDEPIGRLSRMDAIQQQHMAKAGLDREQEKLAQVRRALTLVGDPGFGACESCKKPIGAERLLFQPEVLLCVRCA